jgi:hypothetical protein
MHETLNFTNWKYIFDNYESVYLDRFRNKRFLIKKSRKKDSDEYLKDLARVYKKAQQQEQNWENENWNPLWEKIKKLSINDKFVMHAKPVHTNSDQWWVYECDKHPVYGWGCSFNWIDEPVEKIHHDIGQMYYDLDCYSDKFRTRIAALRNLLEISLLDYVNHIYDFEWLKKNQFSDKLIKINLLGDYYWYKISRNRHGVPVWENFIWQSDNTEKIYIF